MARTWLRSGALLAALLFTDAATDDADREDDAPRSVSVTALPNVVRDALSRRFPRGEIRAAFHSSESAVGEAWEVRVRDGLRERELAIDPRGAVLGEREPVALREVPDAAQSAVERRFGRASIWRAERLTAADGTAYVLTFSRGTRLGTAVVQEDGRLVASRMIRG